MPTGNRLENVQSLRYANADIAFATAFATLVTGVFLVGFVRHLGGADLWVNLLAAIPSLFGLLQIPGAIWGRGFPSYKRFVLPGGLVWRLMYVPLILLPLVGLAAGFKLSILLLCVALAAAANVLVNPVYNDWLAELVPSNSRGFFFSRRNAIASGVGASVGLLGALLLDAFRRAGQADVGFSVIFGLGIVCAAISFGFFLKMRDVPRENPVRANLKQSLAAFGTPFGDRDFRKVLTFLALFVSGQMFAGNLFAAFALETLELDFTVIQGAAVTFAVGNILAARFWGFLSDKYGNKPVLVIAGLALALNPLPWMLAIPGRDVYNAVLLLSTHVFMGAIWSAVSLAQFNLILATARPEDRGTYIGAGLTTTAVAGGVAPLLGAALMTTLRGAFEVETAYKLVFLVTLLLRFGSVFFVLRVREEGATPIRTTLQHLRSVTPRGVRAMRSLARSGDPHEREEAIHSVGQERAALAVDAIVLALNDPSPRVRREAANALARLENPKAVAALVQQVEGHPDLVEEEAVEALGVIGAPGAVPALTRLLGSPRSVIRRAAARALGRIGSRDAVEALVQAATDPADVDLRRASLQALRMIGAADAAPVIAPALLDAHPSVRIAAAEAVADLGLRSAAGEVRRSLAAFTDEASSEVAYALGAVGERGDLPAILREARDVPSALGRQRCLLGAARLLGVERDVYRLMLLDGIDRDTSMLAIYRQILRQNRAFREPLGLLTDGREEEALRRLAETSADPVIQSLAEHPVEEASLIALAYLARPTRRP
jgi:HEAT repeat protein/MFS family permease